MFTYFNDDSGDRNMDISHIYRFERLRDGGSLIVSFQSVDSCEYWVMFPIVGHCPESPLYKAPVLLNRTTGIEVSLSRNGAKQWIKKLEPFFDSREELPYVTKQSEVEILNRMLALCEANT